MNNPKGSPQEAFATAFDSALSSLLMRVRLGKLLFLYRSPTFEKNCDTVHAFVDKFISKALKVRESRKGVEKTNERDGKYVFLNELLKQTQNPIELRDEILTVLLGGRDTTAGLLSHVFRELMQQPAVLEKLKDEIAQLQGRKPDYEELKNMKYLKYVLQESK
jgi:cytochrome P450